MKEWKSRVQICSKPSFMMGTMNLIEWRKREQKEEVNSSSRLSGSHIIKSQLQFWLFVINLTKKGYCFCFVSFWAFISWLWWSIHDICEHLQNEIERMRMY